MGLDQSTEPLRQIAVIVVAVITAIGVGITAIVGMVDAPWVAPTGVALTAAAGVLATWLGIEKGRSVVTPAPNVAALLAAAEPVVEPAGVDTGASTLTEAPDVDAIADAAAKAAGLD